MKVVVVGAGIVGSATAWRLAARGCEVHLVEQFAHGHTRGSSHGNARITRTTYKHPAYVALASTAHAIDWPELAAESGRTLLHRGGDAVVWGPEGPRLAAYADAISDPAAVVQLPVAEARQRFPGLRFPDAERVLWDRTAAVVAAADTMNALREVGGARGVVLHEHTRVTGYDAGEDGVIVHTDGGDLTGDMLVLAQGPWAVAQVGLRATPARQHVGYWPLKGARAGAFPCWIHLDTDEAHYGLPGIGEEVLKAALHYTAADDQGDDPDVTVSDADPVAIAAVEAHLREWFDGLGPLVHSETCFYTNTPDEDFVLGHLAPRVVIGGGLSGHGFKFGPLLGRILADLVMDGQCRIPAFADHRERFSPGSATQ